MRSRVRPGVYHEQKKLSRLSKLERLTVQGACYIYDILTGVKEFNQLFY